MNKLGELRQILQKDGLRGFIVPHNGYLPGEDVPWYEQRLKWLSGFTGSAGNLLVTLDSAYLFVDGRYAIQAKEEVGPEMTVVSTAALPFYKALAQVVHSGDKIGFDPFLHSVENHKALSQILAGKEAKFKAVKGNPIDQLWKREIPIEEPLFALDVKYSGEKSEDKIKRIADILSKDKIDAAIISAPENIAWLLNLRSNEVPFTPVFMAQAIIYADCRLDLFIFPERINSPLPSKVNIKIPQEFITQLQQLKHKKIRIDPSLTQIAVKEALHSAKAEIIESLDPIMLAKACKNPVEIAGFKDAHREDALAMAQFLYWLEKEAIDEGADEIAAAAKIDQLRLKSELCQGLSFASIAASGPNGAIVHYRPNSKQNRKLSAEELFLVDSGGQYFSGTTDVTRTIWLSKFPPIAEVKRRFTLVLKGHIALAQAVFPEGTTGSQLDILARQFLWQEGLDYDHGTGHGVGHFLSVHEGPARISKLANNTALQPGMVLSNEPGYYKAGEYGIRIENLVLVEENPVESERKTLRFQTLTLVPIDLKLLDLNILEEKEKKWLNDYHRKIREKLTSYLSPDVKDWLVKATEAV